MLWTLASSKYSSVRFTYCWDTSCIIVIRHSVSIALPNWFSKLCILTGSGLAHAWIIWRNPIVVSKFTGTRRSSPAYLPLKPRWGWARKALRSRITSSYVLISSTWISPTSAARPWVNAVFTKSCPLRILIALYCSSNSIWRSCKFILSPVYGFPNSFKFRTKLLDCAVVINVWRVHNITMVIITMLIVLKEVQIVLN